MIQLSISAAHAYVRKALDELTSVEELGMLVSPDSMDLHKLVEGFIVEAAVRVHTNAPAILLDGIVGKKGEDYAESATEKVVTVTMLKDCVRIASVQALDSDYVVTAFAAEDSVEARKQLNSYTRGVYDDPRAVLMKEWAGDYLPKIKYYSLKEDYAASGENPTLMKVEYVPYPTIDETIIMVCPRLEYNVLNEITAMVLDALNEREKAELYRAKALNYGA